MDNKDVRSCISLQAEHFFYDLDDFALLGPDLGPPSLLEDFSDLERRRRDLGLFSDFGLLSDFGAFVDLGLFGLLSDLGDFEESPLLMRIRLRWMT